MNDELFSTAGFMLRIRSLMAREGIDHWNEFEAEIGMRGAASRWKSGRDKPMPESLLKIKKRFNVSIDWLLTGEETSAIFKEFTPESYDARPLAPLEADLLIKIKTLLDQETKSQTKHLRPDQEMRLVTRIYNDCAEDRVKPDAIMVKRYLWIID